MATEATEAATPAPARKARAAKAKAPTRGVKAKAPKTTPKGKVTTGKSVIDPGRYTYSVSDTRTASGRKSVDTGDRVAAALRGLDTDAVLKALKANGLTANPAWDNLNPGMVRMNAGNMLRRLVRNGTSIKIGATTVATLGK